MTNTAPRPEVDSCDPFKYCLTCGNGFNAYIACVSDACRFVGEIAHDPDEKKRLIQLHNAKAREDARRERDKIATANARPDAAEVWADMVVPCTTTIEQAKARSSWPQVPVASDWGNIQPATQQGNNDGNT